MNSHCAWCKAPIEQKPTGRPRRFCSEACKKRHQRAFPALPPDLKPLPEPDPLPRRSPEERFVVLASDLVLIETEAAELAPQLPAEMAWKAGHIADGIRKLVIYCFGRTP